MSWENIQSITAIILLMVLSAAVFVWTDGMTPGAELFPRIMAGGMALFGVIELVSLSKKVFRSAPQEQAPDPRNWPVIIKAVFYMGLFFLLIVLFFVALTYVGFALSAIIFMLISMVLIGGKRALRKWPVAVLLPLALILIFQYGLDVHLPGLNLF